MSAANDQLRTTSVPEEKIRTYVRFKRTHILTGQYKTSHVFSADLFFRQRTDNKYTQTNVIKVIFYPNQLKVVLFLFLFFFS